MLYKILQRFSGKVLFEAECDSLKLCVELAVKKNANLSDANLRNANLSDANLWNANLRNADLWNANLRNANLSDANLRNANLSDANLRNANLSDANLRNANLSDANLWNAIGNKVQVKTMQIEKYSISYTYDRLQIGCENHAIDEWKNFTDSKIKSMDRGALEWWQKWKPVIFQIIEMSPAEPTKKDSV